MAGQFVLTLSLEFELPFCKGSKKGCQAEMMKFGVCDEKSV